MPDLGKKTGHLQVTQLDHKGEGRAGALDDVPREDRSEGEPFDFVARKRKELRYESGAVGIVCTLRGRPFIWSVDEDPAEQL